eukprot:snap_masked-scaffold_21-processed-gene-0.19-mRNA-1 protein AED:1.00 eAED:1.00 QI:0/0/0/0/1/1/2/0/62
MYKMDPSKAVLCVQCWNMTLPLFRHSVHSKRSEPISGFHGGYTTRDTPSGDSNFHLDIISNE